MSADRRGKLPPLDLEDVVAKSKGLLFTPDGQTPQTSPNRISRVVHDGGKYPRLPGTVAQLSTFFVCPMFTAVAQRPTAPSPSPIHNGTAGASPCSANEARYEETDGIEQAGHSLRSILACQPRSPYPSGQLLGAAHVFFGTSSPKRAPAPALCS
ncbi:hypothetical protein VTI28DRAFT_9653 [Corynascus sepedonium]